MSAGVLNDCFTFVINVPENPSNRSGVLSIVNSIYDPLGLALPVTIRGRMLLRDLMKAATKDNELGMTRSQVMNKKPGKLGKNL